ncbi:MAG: SDR family NAD(P)-dependent oxidoreductase [Methylovirgula sp.]
MRQPRAILITGASSGIGRALALAYAAPGVHLSLLGRSEARLADVAAAAEAQGASVAAAPVDVRDREAMSAWVAAADAVRPFDLAIANAGITSGLADGAMAEEPEAVRALLATNLFGVLNTIEPLIAPMCERRQGHIAVIGSLAGLRGLPFSPAYSASKAAVHAYAESLRGRLERRGVLVSLVVAGFVKTPLNDSISAAKPFEVSDARAAEIIKTGLGQGRAVIAFPAALYLATRLARSLPPRFVDWLFAHFSVNVPETKERVKP